MWNFSNKTMDVVQKFDSNLNYDMIEHFYQIWGFLLLFVGIPCNLLSGFIMGTDQSNRTTTRILMTLLSMSDTAVLLTAVLRYWMREFFRVDVRSFGWFGCKLHYFCSAISSDYAVGTLCALAVERFLVVAFPHKAKELVTVQSVILGMTGLFIGVALKNSINFVFMDLDTNSTAAAQAIALNMTDYQPEYSCKFKPNWQESVRMFAKFDYITYAVLPYCILFSCNVYIYAILKRQSRLLMASRQAAGIRTDTASSAHNKSQLNTKTGAGAANDAVQSRRRKRKPENVIKVLTALTVLHVITTLPGTTTNLLKIYFNIQAGQSKEEKKRFNTIQIGLILLMFTNNATNFFAYLKSSTGFRKRVFKLCCCWVRPFQRQWSRMCCFCCSCEPSGAISNSNIPGDIETTRQFQMVTILPQIEQTSDIQNNVELHNGHGVETLDLLQNVSTDNDDGNSIGAEEQK